MHKLKIRFLVNFIHILVVAPIEAKHLDPDNGIYDSIEELIFEGDQNNFTVTAIMKTGNEIKSVIERANLKSGKLVKRDCDDNNSDDIQCEITKEDENDEKETSNESKGKHGSKEKHGNKGKGGIKGKGGSKDKGGNKDKGGSKEKDVSKDSEGSKEAEESKEADESKGTDGSKDSDESKDEDSDERKKTKSKPTLLRKNPWKAWQKSAAKQCKKACTAAYKDVCSFHDCRKSFKKDMKKQCKISCKDFFIE